MEGTAYLEWGLAGIKIIMQHLCDKGIPNGACDHHNLSSQLQWPTALILHVSGKHHICNILQIALTSEELSEFVVSLLTYLGFS